MNEIALVLTGAIIYMFGYLMGSRSNTYPYDERKPNPPLLPNINRLIKKQITKPKLGAINQLTQDQIFKRDHPKLAQEEAEMKKAFGPGQLDVKAKDGDN